MRWFRRTGRSGWAALDRALPALPSHTDKLPYRSLRHPNALFEGWSVSGFGLNQGIPPRVS
jgi:hypothetical protein